MSDAYYSIDCTEVSDDCPVEFTIYGYYPNLGINVFYCVWMGIFALIHVFLGVRYKTRLFGALIAVGAVSEMIGYIGRIILNSNPWSVSGFDIQICCLIFAPSFFAAAIYFQLKGMIRAIGPQFSPLRSDLYPWIFITCDIISLSLQAVGGGIAASATTVAEGDDGGYIMLAGIVFQVATFTALYVLAIIYVTNLRRNMDSLSKEASDVLFSRDFKIFASGILFSSLVIYIRCVYRIADLADGWASVIMRNQLEFIILDGVMCCIAILVLTVCSPAFFFKIETSHPEPDREKRLETGSLDTVI